MPRVSVIIPTYNRASYLGRAIQSALDQDVDDLEVVVLDDGSTDNTRDVVSRFADRRLVYVQQENQGMTAAFNAGIAHSTGDCISVLGSDDWYLPNGLSPLLRKLEASPQLGAASGGFIFVDEAGCFVREAQPWSAFPQLDTKTWMFWCPTVLQASLIRRDWIDSIGGFDLAVKCAQDWDLGLRLAYAGCRMAWIESSVFNYRLHPYQYSRDVSTVRRDYQFVLDKFFAQPDLLPELRAMRPAAYAHVYVKGAIRAFEAGQWEDGSADVERAIQLDPHLLDHRGQRIFDLVVGWANDVQTSEPDRYLNAVFDHLPASAGALKGRRRAAMAAMEMGRFFTAYENRDLPGVRRALLRAVARDPSWLRNRGVISIALEATLGRGLMEFARTLTHRSRA